MLIRRRFAAASFALVMLLLGCADLSAIVKVSGTNGPATSAAAVRKDDAKPQELCDKASFTSSLSVDSAYTRAMRSFGFRTAEERKLAARDSFGAIDEGFKHIAQPGAFYKMTDYASVATASGAKQLWSSLELWKEGAQRTNVKLNYCTWVRPGEDDPRRAINEAMKAALK